jgi:Secretion system C-terminal sorting domain
MKKFYILTMALALFAGITNASTKHLQKAKSANSNDLNGEYTTSLTLTEGTYNLTGNVLIDDTLTVMPGVKVLATGNYNIEVAGALICNGTDAKPITFTPSDEKTAYDSLGVSGWWGGFLIDSSSLYVSVTYTHINYTGGVDASGGTQASFDVEGSQSYNGHAKIIFEDNWMFGGIDDAIHLKGYITVSVKRNVLQRLGGPDGDLMNIKAGVQGDIAYNYIWNSANSSIKLNTGKSVLSPQTKLNIYNNTMLNGSWRKVGELSSAILIDQFSAANIYNNIIVACRNGINITTKADLTNTKYGNNLIYTYNATADSFTNNAYIPGAAGTQQSSDKVAAGLTACGTVFTHWDSDITVDTADNNIPTLKTGSPAIGAGTTTATLWTTFSGGAPAGTAMALNTDMGAYPSDNSGNKHLPTPYPGYTAQVGINTLPGKLGLSAFPNPVINELTLTCPSSIKGNLQIVLIDLQGKVVLSKICSATNQLKINVSNLSKGLYFCRVINGSTMETIKFLKN